ncbi:MAG: DUF2188 domain-containing protein [Peptostreptococcaceae bacterium]|nr:DUF2188 domain-containing protein [Peptostreptococcaceae bacterium]
MNRKTQHVVPNLSGGWSVKKGGSTKATKNFDVKEAAVKFGKQVAIHQKSELVVHKRDGTIQNPNSNGKDPSPPKNRKR